MNKKIWQPLVLGGFLGLLAGIATVTGLSFPVIDFADNTHTIGFYVALFLLAAALGGPLAGAIAPVFWVSISALFGPPDLKELVSIPAVFWSNLLALGTTTALVGFAFRWIFERLKIPARFLAWAGIILAYYAIGLPASFIPQYFLLGGPTAEILPALLFSYQTYFPQALFDVFFTSLVFIALPLRFKRPLWYESMGRNKAEAISELRKSG